MLNDVDLTFDFQSQSGAKIFASRIDIEPFGDSGIPYKDDVTSNQYWIIHRYGTGNLLVDIEFSFPSSQVLLNESNTNRYVLYSREWNSVGDWDLVGVASSSSLTKHQPTTRQVSCGEAIPTGGNPCQEQFEDDFHEIHAAYDTNTAWCVAIAIYFANPATFVACQSWNIYTTCLAVANAIDDYNNCMGYK